MASHRLLTLPFSSLSSYAHTLELVLTLLDPFASRVLLFLAAAVSDYYLPLSSLPTHKMQSSSGPLQLSLPVVPKLLPVARYLCPAALCVSFKLDTQWQGLREKAARAVDEYGMDAVVCNELQSRYDRLLLVYADRDGTEINRKRRKGREEGKDGRPDQAGLESEEQDEIEYELCELLSQLP